MFDGNTSDAAVFIEDLRARGSFAMVVLTPSVDPQLLVSGLSTRAEGVACGHRRGAAAAVVRGRCESRPHGDIDGKRGDSRLVEHVNTNGAAYGTAATRTFKEEAVPTQPEPCTESGVQRSDAFPARVAGRRSRLSYALLAGAIAGCLLTVATAVWLARDEAMISISAWEFATAVAIVYALERPWRVADIAPDR